MKKINDDLKNDNCLPLYFVYGNEKYLLNNVKNKFISKFSNQFELKSYIFDEDNFDINDCINKININPFLSTKKLLVFENVNLFNKDVDEVFYTSINNNLEINTILFLEDNYDIKKNKKNNLYKLVEQYGYVLNINNQAENILIKYVEKKLNQNKISYNELTIKYFLQKVGNDLFNISNELDKLISYVEEKKILDKEDIDLLTSDVINNNVWDLIAAINNKNVNLVLKIYSNLLYLNEKAESIFNSVKYNYKQLINIKYLLLRNRTLNEIIEMEKLERIPRFVVQNIIKLAKSIDFDFLFDKINKISYLTKDYKTGMIDKDLAAILLII